MLIDDQKKICCKKNLLTSFVKTMENKWKCQNGDFLKKIYDQYPLLSFCPQDTEFAWPLVMDDVPKWNLEKSWNLGKIKEMPSSTLLGLSLNL